LAFKLLENSLLAFKLLRKFIVGIETALKIHSWHANCLVIYCWQSICLRRNCFFCFNQAEDLPSSTGWVAWGINPSSPQMVGTQALGAFRNSTGVTVRTYDVTAAVKNSQQSLVPGPVTVAFSNYSASATAAGTVTISGTVTLHPGQSTSLNLVWNRGPAVVAVTAALSSHLLVNDNLASTAVVDMTSGAQTGGGQIPNKRLKDVGLRTFIHLPKALKTWILRG